MSDISLRQYVPFLGSNTVTGMAKKVGLPLPPPTISLRNLLKLAERIILPLAPVDLQPQNGASSVPNNPYYFFRDPAAGTPAAAFEFEWEVIHDYSVVGPPDAQLAVTSAPLTPPGIKWGWPLPYGDITLRVAGKNTAGMGPYATSTFTVFTPPPPQPAPTPPRNLVGISKLSLYNCQIERHDIYVWVRSVAPIVGPWGLNQSIPNQYNKSDQCPYGEDGLLADSVSILTRNGEGGGFPCIDNNIYQVSIIDLSRPACDGMNDPDNNNCVVESTPTFFKFSRAGAELTVMLEDGRLSPFPS
jgi:hypothetical protein